MPPDEPLGLGLDVGGTATRWALADRHGTVVATGKAPAASGHIFRADAAAAVDAMLDAVSAGLAGRPVAGLLAGVTGVDDTGTEAAALAGRMARAVGAEPSTCALCNDVALAVLTRFGPGEGVVTYAGTGAVGALIDRDWQLQRVGGMGHIIDDAGSGYWIGREALEWLARRMDATGGWPMTPLADAIAAQVGGNTWPDLRRYTYSDPRTYVAEITRAVIGSAATDPAAAGILNRAAAELTDMADRLLGRVAPVPAFALMGGIFAAHPPLTAAVEAAFAERWPTMVRRADAEATDTTARAAQLAAQAAADGAPWQSAAWVQRGANGA